MCLSIPYDDKKKKRHKKDMLVFFIMYLSRICVVSCLSSRSFQEEETGVKGADTPSHLGLSGPAFLMFLQKVSLV